MRKGLMWTIATLAIAIAATAGAQGFEPPQITNKGYPQPLLRPTCTVKILPSDLKVWPIDLDQVTAYEYAKGPAVTVVHGRWYALNGLARSWARHERMKVGPEFFPISEMTTLPLPGRPAERLAASVRFLSDLNDVVTRRCPE